MDTCCTWLLGCMKGKKFSASAAQGSAGCWPANAQSVWAHMVAVVWGTEPYVVKEWQDRLSQPQGDGAGYRVTILQEQIAEEHDGHSDHVTVIVLQELHKAFGQVPHSFGLCRTQLCETPPCCLRLRDQSHVLEHSGS